MTYHEMNIIHRLLISRNLYSFGEITERNMRAGSHSSAVFLSAVAAGARDAYIFRCDTIATQYLVQRLVFILLCQSM